MKLIFILPILFFLNIRTFGQQPFIISLEQPELDYLSDVVKISDRFYFIQNRLIQLEPPFNRDSYCDMLITTENGSIIEIVNLNGYRTQYQRILKAIGDDLYLIGFIKSDSCSSMLVISKFNIQTHNLSHLSSYDFCENIMLNIRIVNGLSQQTFIEEYHAEDTIHVGIEKLIFSIDSNYNLTLKFDDLTRTQTLSVDFSRKGYVIANCHLYNFYDADFNYIKQRFQFDDDVFADQETHTPFGHHFILQQTIQDRFDLPDAGIQLRLEDSNLVVKKKAIILPMHPFYRGMNLPYFGGIDIKNENEIWASGFFGYQPNTDSCFYSITKLDSNLNIICQHFLGYDTWYRIFGIRALETGGAIVFGNRVREGHGQNEGEDIYAIRVGENCELPITSIEESPYPIISISVYPNPGINDLNFSINGFDPATLYLEMTDELGQILFTAKDLSQSILVPDLPAGQYFYRILQKNKLLGVGSWVKL